MENKKVFILLVTLLVLVFSPIFKDKTSWATVTPFEYGLNVPRAFHKSTVLCDGRVLVTGGYNEFANGAVKSTEFYHPRIKAFSNGPKMNLPHMQHGQFLLKNCEVLIVDTNGIETYSPETNTFTLWTDKLRGASNYSDYPTYTLLRNSDVMVTGGATLVEGNEETIDSVEIVDARNKKVYKVDNLLIPRTDHAAIATDKGVYVIGGQVKSGKTYHFLSNVEFYDFQRKKFIYKTELSKPRALGVYALPLDYQSFLIFGGTSIKDETNSDKFLIGKKKTNMPIELYNTLDDTVQAVRVPSANLFCDENNTFLLGKSRYLVMNHNYAYEYFFDNNQFEWITSMKKYPVLHSSAVELNENEILFTGGDAPLEETGRSKIRIGHFYIEKTQKSAHMLELRKSKKEKRKEVL